MINFSGLKMNKEPFPYGRLFQVFEKDQYRALSDSYPDEKLFLKLDGGYNKLSMSEGNNKVEYKTFIKNSWAWYGLYLFIKSPEFIWRTFEALKTAEGVVLPPGTYTSRFEFSSLPTNGGFIKPHRDIPSKVVTIVIGMQTYEEEARSRSSEPSISNAGTMILEPVSSDLDLKDYESNLTEFKQAAAIPCDPNSGVIFVKKKNSWHAVGPIQGPEGSFRRSITINIERAPK